MMKTSTANSSIPNRTRTNIGVEFSSELIWKNWEVGGDYPKKLVVKNTSTDVLEIKYDLPKSKYFLMGNSQSVKLSPGVSASFEIRFRPDERKDYHDNVKIIVSKRGEINTRISALLPRAFADLPSEVILGFCPTMETTKKVFEMKNTGEIPFEFNWTVKEPFNFTPSSGKLQVGEKIDIEIAFTPTEASVFISSAVCKLSSNDTYTLQLNGVGKITHINANETKITFGKSPIGNVTKREVILKNTSLVPASLSISKVEKDFIEEVFIFEPTIATILPGETLNLKISYSPKTLNTFDCDNFDIKTPGGNTIRINCSGIGIGPEIITSPSCINFGDVNEGKQIQKIITLENRSSIEAYYNIKSDKEGIFSVEKTSDIIPANQTRKITISFNARKPINYYKRLFILVKNQGVIYVDLIGTGFSSTVKPPSLTMKHVLFYRARILNGQQGYSPSDIEHFLTLDDSQLRKLEGEEKTNAQTLLDSLQKVKILENNTIDIYSNFNKEYFTIFNTTPLSINCRSLSFGSISRFTLAEYKTVTISNNTNGRITCDVVIPKLTNGKPCPFNVFPESIDIKPMSNFSFKIGFKPENDNQFYANEIEFICYFKTDSSLKLNNEYTSIPPWVLPLKVFGNTFTNTAALTPKYSLEPTNTVTFPSCLVGDETYKSLTIYNESDIPMPFEFILDAGVKNIIDCHPNNGIISEKSFEIILFKFSPNECKTYTENIKCILNESSTHSITLQIFGIGFLPTLKFENDNIYFKPTHVGTSSIKETTISNPSRIPVSFELDVPKEFSSVFNIDPMKGILRANESKTIQWIFTPQSKNVYTIKVPCNINSTSNNVPIHDRSYLSIVGEGTSGGISVEPTTLDFGTILIKESETKQIYIFNSSYSAIPYVLVIKEYIGDSCINNSKKLYSPEAKGFVPPRSRKVVDVIYKPTDRKIDKFAIYVNTSCINNDNTLQQLETMPKCEIVGIGSFPTIGITDIRCDGYTKMDLWDKFSVNSVNNELRKLVDNAETLERTLDFNEIVKTMNLHKFNMGASAIKSKDAIVYVTIENLGKVNAQFSLSLPFDAMVNVENWAQDQVPKSDEEQKQLEIYLNNLFEIIPNEATLLPGESKVFAFIYRHKIVDRHSVPVLLNIKDGTNLALELFGETITPTEKHLQYPALHNLETQEIGSLEFPIQYCKLFNPTDFDIDVIIDDSPLKQLAKENYDFEILILENKKFTVPEHSYYLLKLIFRPIEVKDYEVELPIHIVDNGTILLTYFMTLTGKGVETVNLRTIENDENNGELSSIIKIPSNQVPRKQSLIVPNQLVLFSMEVIDFDVCPSLSINRRMLTITNLSETDFITFKWKLNTEKEFKIEILPEEGILKPKETKSLKVSMFTGSIPQILLDVIECEITNESKKERKERRKKKYENTLLHYSKEEIDDNASISSLVTINNYIDNTNDFDQHKNTKRRESVISKSTNSRTIALMEATYSTAIPRYLPSSKTIKKVNPLERPTSAKDDKFGTKPIPPQKYFITLHARIIPLENFKYNSQTRKEWDEQFVLIDNNQSSLSEEQQLSIRPITPRVDKQFISNILTDILQEIVNDKEVTFKATQIEEDNDCFYCEFADTPRSSRPSTAATVSTLIMTPTSPSSPTNNSNNSSSIGGKGILDFQEIESTTPLSLTRKIKEKNKLLNQMKVQQLLEWVLDETLYKITLEIIANNNHSLFFE